MITCDGNSDKHKGQGDRKKDWEENSGDLCMESVNDWCDTSVNTYNIERKGCL